MRLSTWRARSVQLLERGRVGRAAAAVFSRQFARPAPRHGDALLPAVADLARPIRWPQRGRGRIAIDEVPAIGTPQFARLLDRARGAFDVAVSPQLVVAHRSAVAVLAAAGAPVRVDRHLDSGDGDGGDGDGLVAMLQLPAGTDARERELRSVRLRRAAHDEIWRERPGAASIVLASRRPDDLPSAIEQVRRQRDVDLQLVVGLHGDGWPDDTDHRVAEMFDDSIVTRFGSDIPLGSVLDELVARADGRLISKWDDDDWYGPDHIADLIRAYRYSGAELVGKAAEFVRLEGADLTIRRFDIGAENFGTTLAGGTMLTSKSWLTEIGGWTAVPQGVDRVLLDATARHGGRSYRTHGFQYVLRRRAGAGHTWAADEARFAAQASSRRAGLDLAFADVGAGSVDET